jgi:serine protease Do
MDGLQEAGVRQIIDKLRRSTVQVLSGRGGGSGVVWGNGVVVTNAHVASGRQVEIVDAEGRRKSARITKRNIDRDLAVLEVPGGDLPRAEIGDSGSLRSGQIVLAIGHPLGIAGAVAVGVIHAAEGQRWIQADIRLAPGNSGGILADSAGRVIGINTMIFNGLGFAIPSREVNEFLRSQSLSNLGGARAA